MIDYNAVLNNKYVKIILEWLEVIVIAFAIAIVCKFFVVETDIVKGVSMEPSFVEGEKVLVEKLSYKFSSPKRGDVIVFRPIGTKDNYIKRIIALPSEEVDIKDGNVLINGEVLKENYIKGENFTGLDHIEFPYIVPEGQYFVLGDNRMHSVDSRALELGEVSKKNIKGRCFFIISPSDYFGKIEKINYEE